ncbi:hypothetical protein BH24CHL6_BH24CHL6_08720 [soil metagenome]
MTPDVEARIKAADFYLARSFRVSTAWGTLPDGTCRCPKGANCDQKPGKHPIGQHGFHEATADPDVIRTRLSAGSEPNLLVVPPSGCFGWDLDGDDAARIAALEAEYGPLPPTFGHQTPNGQHVIYRWPSGVERPRKVLDVVTRWGGHNGEASGYLIGAGSRIGDKSYRILRDEQGQPLEIAELPEAWVRTAKPLITVTGDYGPGYRLPESVRKNDRYFAIRDYVAHLWGKRIRDAEEVFASVCGVLAPRFAEALPVDGPDSIRSRFVRVWRDIDKNLPDRPPNHSSGLDAPSERKELRYLTAAQLVAEGPEDVPWLVPPWVARGSVSELDGRPKAAGKTTFLLHLIGATLDGQPFLGQPTRRTPVVLLSEQGPTSLRATLERAGLAGRTDLYIVLWRDVRGTSWRIVVESAVDLCRSVGAELLVVDTLPQFAGLAGDSENDAGAALEAMEPLQAAAADGLAVLVSRHDRKGGGEVGESARGSSAFAGAVDVILALRRGDGESRPTIRHLHALSRFEETPDELVIELTEQGYVALGEAADFAVEEAKAATVAALAEEPLTTAQIVEATGLKRTTVYAALAALTDAGSITREGTGKRGNPYTYSSAASGRPEPISSYIGPDETVEGSSADPGEADMSLVWEARRIFTDDLAPEATA